MSLVLIALSTVCASVPMLFFLIVVWLMDRYGREPVWLVGLTFLWGAIGSIVCALVGSTVVQVILGFLFGLAGEIGGFDTAVYLDAAGPVLIAPLVEEPSKAVFLLFVIWNRQFDNMTDGFVYGAAAGLGFGMTENFMYFSSVSGDLVGWGETVVIRTLYSAVMHATATSIVGAMLGFARFRGFIALFFSGSLGLVMAMSIHMLWNGLLTIDQFTFQDGTLLFANLAIFPFEVLAIFLWFQVCQLEESYTIYSELKIESEAGLIPETHPRILASWIQRHLTSWAPKELDHHAYVEAATSLAIRKKQVRQMGRRATDFYRDDVERLRRQITKLLSATKK